MQLKSHTQKRFSHAPSKGWLKKHLQIKETTLNESHFFTYLVEWISCYWKIWIPVALFWAWYSSHFSTLSCDNKLSSSAAHLFTGGKLPFCEISNQALLPPDCFQQHNNTWQVNARCTTSTSWNNPTLPCLGVLWWTLASTNCRFSYLWVLQAAFIPPQTSPTHTCSCSLLLQLWENTNRF